ncbi:hypothetical protein [Streptomyces sp. 5-10]|uniref:hypothetical protein n=1 Tax=Streptomyces sp. 5-10 TaxID=878925 RepID=UPI00168AB24F|nr:hypothetical protein [Streptomyces sp. 5-10]MBD3004567.1 hypothetical protein [Streptomyces sp. 5-10]
MDALRELWERVEEGWRVKVTNHDYAMDGGERIVTLKFTMPDQTYRADGRTHLIRKGGPAFLSREVNGRRREFRHELPVEGDDFEVEGRTLRIYNPSHAYVHGGRAIVLTLEFQPPAG